MGAIRGPGPLRDERGHLVRLGLAVLAAQLAAASYMLWLTPAGSVVSDLPLDDAYIHLVYAEGLAHGEGFAYNEGQPEAGTSSPAWASMLSTLRLARLSGDALALGAKALGLLWMWVAAMLGAHLAATSVLDRRAGWLAGLAIALDPGLTMGALSGMEVAPAAALLLGSLVALEARRWTLTGLGLAGAVMTRHELLVALPVVAAAAVLLERGRSRSPGGALLRVLAPPLALFALWSARNLSVTGRPLPNTFYVKHGDGPLSDLLADVPTLVAAVGDAPVMAHGAGLVPLALGVLSVAGALGEARKPGFLRWAPAVLVWLGVPLLVLAGVVWAHHLSEWRPLYWRRHVLPVGPVLIVPWAIGVTETLRTLARRATEPRARRLLGAFALMAALGAAALLPFRMARDGLHYALSARNIQDMHGRVAVWLDAHTARDEWIASHDAGLIRWRTRRPLLDLAGLNDHRIPRHFAEVRAQTEPRYWVVFESWFPRLVRDPAYRVVYRARTEHLVLCSACQQDELLVLERR